MDEWLKAIYDEVVETCEEEDIPGEVQQLKIDWQGDNVECSITTSQKTFTFNSKDDRESEEEE